MHPSTILFLINDDIRAVSGKYEEHGRAETFKTMDQTLKVGDLAVVQSGTRHGMTVVEITAVDLDLNYDGNEEVKWVVQKIDKPGFNKTLELEREAITAVQSAERRRKREELRKTMFADHEATINALALANHSDGTVAE
jgi:hypothetical protein